MGRFSSGWPVAFVHLMKTGGQTMRAVLRKNFGLRHCDMLLMEDAIPRDWRWVKLCYPCLRSIRGHCVVPHDETFDRYFPSARFFTFVRDPIKRAISHYRFREQSGDLLDPLRDWLVDYGDYMCLRLAGERNAQAAIDALEERQLFVGITERFDESLLLWSHWTGLEHLKLNYRTVNKRKVSTEQRQRDLSPERVEMLREYHVQDQKLYDYVCDEIFPRQVKRWGEDLDERLAEFQKGQTPELSNRNFRSQLGRFKRNSIYRAGVRKLSDHKKKT